MINRSNYDKVIAEFGIENLNSDYKTQHENYLSVQEYYDDDEEIKQTIELYFGKLEKFMSKFRQAETEKIVKKQPPKPKLKIEPESEVEPPAPEQDFEKSTTTPKASRQKKTPRSKSMRSKSDKPKINKDEGTKVKHLSEEVRIIRSFVGLHGKPKSPDAILAFIRRLQRSITKGLISKESPLKKWIEKIQTALIRYYNKMSDQDAMDIPPKELSQLVALAGGEAVYRSIPIISYYIGLKGKQPDESILEKFVKRIEKAVESGKVGKDDPYLNTVKGIVKKLKKYRSGQKVEIDKTELNGLEGILNACGCSSGLGKIYDTKGKSLRRCKKRTYTDAMRKGACSHNAGLGEIQAGVLTAEQMANRQFEHLNFTHPWSTLLGSPAKNFSIMFHGEPGAGKTTLLLKLAEYLANNFGRVLYISSEEHDASTLTSKVNELLRPLPPDLEFAPDLETPDLSDYDFIILDSVNDLGLKLEDFKRLKKENPETAFILVLQHTKDGDYRGGKDWEHDIQMAAKVENGIVTVYRSRYGVKGSLDFFNHFHTRSTQQNHNINY